MSSIHLSTPDMISLAIWFVALASLVIWGHTFRKHQRDIVGNRKYYYIFSTIMLIVACYGIFGKGLNWGLDFTGGTIIEVGSPVLLKQDSNDIKNLVLKVNPDYDVMVQLGQHLDKGANGKEYQKVLIRVQDTKASSTVQLSPDDAQKVREAVTAGLGVGELVNISETSIGATISDELLRGAFLALGLACLLQLVYITFRFGNQLRFGFSAVVAVVHDSIIMVGLYALSGMPMDSSFVAALLTIAGYSVMDTVVIFDRIREHMKNDVKDTFAGLTNRSVNETMTRSINTSLTTIITCLSLYYFGGVTLKGFAFALLVGVVAGAYSSIFLAAPLVVDCERFAKKRDERRMEEMRLAAEEKAAEKAHGRRSAAPRAAEAPVASKGAEEGEKTASAPAARTSAPAAARSRRRVKGMRR